MPKTNPGQAAFATGATGTPAADVALAEALTFEHGARVAAEASLFGRDRVLSMVSHDLRGPLNAIHSWAHVLERKLASEDPSIARAISGIRTGVEQQVKLIEDVIDRTRTATRNLVLALETVPAQPLIEAELENICATVAQPLGVVVESRLSLINVPATVDPARFGQAVWTLLRYAVTTAAAAQAPDATPRTAVRVELFGETEGGKLDVGVIFTPPAVQDTAAVAPDHSAAASALLPVFAGDLPLSVDNGLLALALPSRVVAAHGGDLIDETLEDGRRRVVMRQPLRAAVG